MHGARDRPPEDGPRLPIPGSLGRRNRSVCVAAALQVMFPPGRARLGTSPRPIGLATPMKTMGMVVVACLAARALAAPQARISTTGRGTSSPRGRGAGRGSQHSGTLGRSAGPRPSPGHAAPAGSPRRPIGETFAASCASAATGATRRPSVRVMRSPIMWHVIGASQVHERVEAFYAHCAGEEITFCNITRPHPWRRFADTPWEIMTRHTFDLFPPTW
jgi:hypothetical protein